MNNNHTNNNHNNEEGSDMDDIENNLIPEQKEEKMIHHFLVELERVKDGEIHKVHLRKLTTRFANEREEDAYRKSLAAHAPVNNIMALNTGNWMPWLLMKRLVGRDFTLVIISHADLAILDGIEAKVNRATFAWANPTSAFFLEVDGETEWGLSSLGLSLEWEKKSAKRAQELARFTSMSLYDEDGSRFMFVDYEDLHLVTAMATRPSEIVVGIYHPEHEGVDPMLVDGINFITRRAVLASILEQPRTSSRDRLFRAVRDGRINRLNARLTYRRGVAKGDWIIVEHRSQLHGADMVIADVNIKKEFRTNGWVLFTAFVHNPVHTPGWNDQTTINNFRALPTAHQVGDIRRYEEGIRNILETGEIPEWIQLTQDVRAEDGHIMMDKLSEDLHRSHVRWQAAGASIQDSYNFMTMAIGGVTRGMEQGWVPQHGLYKRTALPMSNAINAGVVTYTALTVMGGFELPYSGTKLFFDRRFGMVVPDQRFIDTFELHGTWDQDDVADFIRIKIYCSDPEFNDLLMEDGVLDPSLIIYNEAPDAVEAVLVVRSPNGPGEYSIEAIDLDQWYDEEDWNMFHDEVTTVDLATLSRGQGHLLSLVNRRGLPESNTVYGGALTREHALYMIEAQAMNPGIGAIANAMMVWVNTMGPSFPPVMTDTFNNLVDCTQQEADKERFEAVAAELNSIHAQLIRAIEADPTLTVDRKLVTLRSNATFRELVKDRIRDKRMTEISKLYRRVYLALHNDVRLKCLETRAEGELVAKMARVTVGKDIPAWAKTFYDQYNRLLREVDKQHRVKEDDDPFTKMTKSYLRKVAMEQIVAHMVGELHKLGDNKYRYVLGLFKWITRPGYHKNYPYGLYDRIIFQPGEVQSVMDILIDALKHEGIL